MWGYGGIIVALPLHEAFSWDSHHTDTGGERWWRGDGDVYGVLPTSVEISGVSGGWVTNKVTQLRKTQIALYVPELELKSIDPTGGPNTSPTVQEMWDSHAGGNIMTSQTDGQIR